MSLSAWRAPEGSRAHNAQGQAKPRTMHLYSSLNGGVRTSNEAVQNNNNHDNNNLRSLQQASLQVPSLRDACSVGSCCAVACTCDHACDGACANTIVDAPVDA